VESSCVLLAAISARDLLISLLIALYISNHFLGCKQMMESIITFFVPWELVAASMRLMMVVVVGFARRDRS
jgi:hypothetical protein